MGNKTVFILRGLPGSGKSSVADQLATLHEHDRDRVAVCSADAFFMHNGVYSFDASRLGQAHAQCMRDFTRALDQRVERIIIDNTNIKREHWQPYASIAERDGYDVAVITMRTRDAQVCHDRCVHDVPLATIRHMAAEFEP